MSRAYFSFIGSSLKGIVQESSLELKQSLKQIYKETKEELRTGVEVPKAEPKAPVSYLPTIPSSAYVCSASANNVQRLGNRNIAEPFQYDPLPPTSSPQGQPPEFRLVTILPGADQDDIECTLQHESPNQFANRYEALSYVWGTSLPVNPIQLNGKTMRIGASLWQALYHLRLPDASRILWVDAICINQDDKAEKAQQLPLMRDIYRNASQVVVWLGLEEKDSDGNSYTEKGYALVRELADAAEDPKHRLNCGLGRGFDDPVVKELAIDDSIALVFLQNDWYTRVWCTQEIVLAKRASLVSGHHTVDWALACQAFEFVEQHGVWNNVQLGVAPTSYAVHHLATRALSFPPTFDNPADELLFYLHRTRTRVASHPRDKVYGILGLVCGNVEDIDIRPTYDESITTETVFTDITTRLMATSRNLDVLGFCYPRKSTPLPHWVADWRTASSLLKPMMEDAKGSRRVTHASRGLKTNPQWEDNGQTLVLEGQALDTITRVGARSLGQGEKHLFCDVEEEEEVSEAAKKAAAAKNAAAAESELSSFRKTWNWIKHVSAVSWAGVEYVVLKNAVYVDWEAFVADVKPTNPGTQEGDDPMSVFCQTLCTGTLAPGGLAETNKMFNAWLDNLAPIRKLKSWRVDRVGGVFVLTGLIGYIKSTWNDFSEFSKYIFHAEDRRLGVTEKGWLCLLPKTAKPGDQLVILKGGRFPVVLRPREDGKADFVGECYVHGIMDGEVFDEKSCVEIKIR
jgi:hypothetical protein